MKRSDILHTCLLFASAILLFSCRQETVLIKADGTVDDYTPVVRTILEEHPEGNISIHFAPGRYEFFPEKAKTEYLSMSNNDSGDRKAAFLIKYMKNVSVSCDSA